MVEPAPTTIVDPLEAAEYTAWVFVPLTVCSENVVPFDDVTSVPTEVTGSPPMTKIPPVKETLRNVTVPLTPVTVGVIQVVPSTEVRIAPLAPTATNIPPPG